MDSLIKLFNTQYLIHLAVVDKKPVFTKRLNTKSYIKNFEHKLFCPCIVNFHSIKRFTISFQNFSSSLVYKQHRIFFRPLSSPPKMRVMYWLHTNNSFFSLNIQSDKESIPHVKRPIIVDSSRICRHALHSTCPLEVLE